MTMPQDLDKYRRHLAHFALSDDQKVELIQTVWRIMENFVDRAFGLDPVQQIGCQPPVKDAEAEAYVVESGTAITTPYRLTDTFRTKSGTCRGRKI